VVVVDFETFFVAVVVVIVDGTDVVEDGSKVKLVFTDAEVVQPTEP
jgi:hypothetical protein